ncbi:MAG: hypothetical protein ACFFD4_19560 [Candidatus Odinarchaeota archaeon]
MAWYKQGAVFTVSVLMKHVLLGITAKLILEKGLSESLLYK